MVELFDALSERNAGKIIRHRGNGNPKIFPPEKWPYPLDPADEADLRDINWLTKPDKGEYHTRTTTYISCLDDHSNLHDHDVRGLFKALAQFPELLEEYRKIPDPDGKDKSKVAKLETKALEKVNHFYKREMGTAIHDILQDIAEGRDPGFIPPEFEADVEAGRAMLAWLEDRGWEVFATEEFGVQRRFRVAGTTDLILVNWDRGVLKLADWKSGSVDFSRGKFPAQLYGYASMDSVDLSTWDRHPRGLAEGLEVDLEEALVLHLPLEEGRGEIIPVDLVKGREAFELAQKVREYRSYWANVKNWQKPIYQVGDWSA